MKYQMFAIFFVVCMCTVAFGAEEQPKPASEERSKRTILAAAPVAYSAPLVSPYAYSYPYPLAYAGSPLVSPYIASPVARAVASPYVAVL